MPPRLSFSLPIAYVTGWCGLVGKARLKADQSVFVHGCRGVSDAPSGRLPVRTLAGSRRGAAMHKTRAPSVDAVCDYRHLGIGAIKNRSDAVFDTARRAQIFILATGAHNQAAKTGVELDDISGQYFSDCRITKPSRVARQLPVLSERLPS